MKKACRVDFLVHVLIPTLSVASFIPFCFYQTNTTQQNQKRNNRTTNNNNNINNSNNNDSNNNDSNDSKTQQENVSRWFFLSDGATSFLGRRSTGFVCFTVYEKRNTFVSFVRLAGNADERCGYEFGFICWEKRKVSLLLIVV
jgi:hypothetical protein